MFWVSNLHRVDLNMLQSHIYVSNLSSHFDNVLEMRLSAVLGVLVIGSLLTETVYMPALIRCTRSMQSKLQHELHSHAVP